MEKMNDIMPLLDLPLQEYFAVLATRLPKDLRKMLLLSSGGPGFLPITYIVIGNKADIAEKDGTSGSSGNLVDGLTSMVCFPIVMDFLSENFPCNGGLIMEQRFNEMAEQTDGNSEDNYWKLRW
ncbi:predicted protein [Arabidopsis lyrata subsp. lyrata]|uniref:Predicted protein n=1 Tax=Arabidopsis lyrata subsp. lyrata TaxID=81972 RepID=D7LMH4_ARALL|nr:predicted protein [Arabidopsis lyrata subsp. lyrata]